MVEIEESETAYRIQIGGAMMIYTMLEIKQALPETFSPQKKIELDLGGVEECDGAGIQMVQILSHHASQELQGLSITSASAPVLALLTLFHISALLEKS